MNSIINFTLKNKFAVWLITLIITTAGLYAGLNMKLETLPNINTPIVSITTVYPGATPEEVADKVTEPIEKRVGNLNGVNVVSSTSYQNASAIQIEYKFSKDMEEAEDEVKDVLTNIGLPEGVQDPSVSRLSFNAFPVMALSVSNENETISELTGTVEDTILPALEGVDGVSSVEISGQQVEEVQLVFNEEKMNELGLDEETVKGIIQGSDVNVPLGLYTLDKTQKSVVVDGNIMSLEDLENMEIPVMPSAQAQSQGPTGAAGESPSVQAAPGTAAQAPTGLSTVQLSKIADIELVGTVDSVSRTNGRESIGMQIVKSADANTVDVVNAVKEEISAFEKDRKSVV